MTEFSGFEQEAVPQIAEPVVETPQSGETYLGRPVANVSFQHPSHGIWAKLRESKGLEPPFYVSLKSGALAWVPWPGSPLVAQDDRAWEMDLMRETELDLRPAKKEKK